MMRTYQPRIFRAVPCLLLWSCAGGQAVPPPVAPAAEPVALAPVEAAPTAPALSEPPPLVFPQQAFRAHQPEPGAIKSFASPRVARFRLKNGIDVFLVERHELPTISADLVFEGGAVNDKKGKEGTASVCMELMSEGTQKLDKLAFAEAVADLASNVSSYAGGEQQGVSFRTLTSHLDATLDLWADTLLAPGLRQSELDRLLQRRVLALEQDKKSAHGVAGRVGGSVFYGPGHLFGRVQMASAYQAVTGADCAKYVKDFVKPRGARLYIVGDINAATIVDKIGTRLSAFAGAPRASARVGTPRPRAGKIFFIDVPGAPQSVISLGHAGPLRKARDYFATALLSQILGGSFASRINMNLREVHGYAYGARGGFGYTRSDGSFRAGASVRADVTKESVQEIVKEIAGIVATGVTPEELAREQEGSILSLPGQFATGAQVLGSFRGLVYFGLPLDYYDHYIDSVKSVVKVHVDASAKKYLKPAELRVVVVGDGATVLPKLQDLLDRGEIGTGKLVVLDVDGNEIAAHATKGSSNGAAEPVTPPQTVPAR